MDEKTRLACTKLLLTTITRIRDVTIRFLDGRTASGLLQAIDSNPMSGRDTIRILRHSCGRHEDPRFAVDLAQAAEVRVTFYDSTEQVFS